MLSKLQHIRKSIDEIDKEIAELINKRALLALDIAKIKNENKNRKSDIVDYYVPSREKEVIKNVISINNVLSVESIKNIYTEIISACRNLEHPIKIAFLGPFATFTHQAAIYNFGLTNHFIPVQSLNDVISEVENNRANFGVVPVENSDEGSIDITLDILVDTELKICAEVSLKIEQCLLVKDPNVEIRKIYSHSHALAQSRNWIIRNYPNVDLVSVSSTAEAAKKAAKEKFAGAVASEVAAKMYNLCILQKGIQESRKNFTRFFVVGRTITKPTGKDKTSLVFTVNDEIGALYNVLEIFNKSNVNLMKIESRPTKKRAWEYMFFVDFRGHINEKNVIDMIKSLKNNCIFVKSLGSYPEA
ncbi:MAG: prephenate dehydratase [Endomicrobium sp.]|jgi:chorismate mutase/prephenate dehydratase|nr:prephenate dehydratase [Endomicrobium sp.]